MAITSADRARRLEDAWDLTKTSAKALRVCLRDLEKAQGKLVQGGSQSSVSANGRNTQFAPYGPGVSTPQEVADLYRELINAHDTAKLFLQNCATYGIDPFVAEFNKFQIGGVVVPAVVVDSTNRFSQLCGTFDIDADEVVGQAVGDGAIFCWMMYHEQPQYEERLDYSLGIIADGASFV